MKPKQLFDLFRRAVSSWVDDFAPSMGAAISYYTMFSLAPMLVIVIAIAGAVFGREAVQGEIVDQLRNLIGREGAIAVQGLIRSASDTDKGLVAGLISAGVLVIGATTVFAELQSALDRIWHVPESAKPSGIWATLRARLLSFGLILGLAFLLMVSLVTSAAISAFGRWASGLLPGQEFLLQGLNIALSVSLSTVLFAMIFKFMTTAELVWHDVWTGAFVTAVLFEVGKFAIGLYLGKSGVNESFAAAGSVVVLLAWVYYAAQIFLLGAEFTKVYANEHGSVAGAKALAATRAAADAARAGTDDPDAPRRTPHEAAGAVAARTASDVPDYAALARAARAQEEIDARVHKAIGGFTRQALLLGLVSLGSYALSRLERRQRKTARRRHKQGATAS